MKMTRKSAYLISVFILILAVVAPAVTGSGNLVTITNPKVLFPSSSAYRVTLPSQNQGVNVLQLGSDQTELMNTRLSTLRVPVSPSSYSVTLLPINSQKLVKGNSYFSSLPMSSSSIMYNATTPLVLDLPVITPVPENTSASLGGFIIRSPSEGDWINMRANFYDSSKPIYDGLWHYHVGMTPAYWENMALPGSYTIQIENKTTGQAYYCETVTVLPGKTTVIDVPLALCPFCSSC